MKEKNPKKTPAKKNEVDWNQIKVEYITTLKTYAELSEKYGVSNDTMEQKGYKEGWRLERQKISENVLTEAASREKEKRLKLLEELNESDLKTAKGITNHIDIIIATSITKDEMGRVIGSTLSSKDLAALSNAKLNSQKIARLVAGVSTDNTQISGRIVTKEEHELTKEELIAEALALGLPATIFEN